MVATAQLLMVANPTALKISIDGIATELGTPANGVKTALVAYTVVLAGLTLLGAKLGRNLGARRVFRAALVVFGAAMAATALARGSTALLSAQMIAGAAAATLLPTLAALLAGNCQGARQGRLLGWLAALQATSLVPAYLFAGALGAFASWRLTFAALAVLAGGAFLLSGKLAQDRRHAREPVDAVGVLIVVAAVVLIGFGSDKLASWGVLRAQPGAPFSVLSLSPAVVVIAGGGLLLKTFLGWSRICIERGRAPLVAPELLGSAREWSVLLGIFAIGAIGAGVTFLIPLYLEVVQGRNSFYTALALIPFTVTSFAAAIFVLRVRLRLGSRLVARSGFAIVAVGLTLLGITIRNDWSNAWVVASMVLAGLGEGALATHLLHVLATTAPRPIAGDVEPLCGTASYLAAGVGTALSGAFVIAVLGASLDRNLADNAALPAEIRAEINLDRVGFVSNDRLQAVLEQTAATPEQVAEAVRINTHARLVALKVSFFALAALALLAFLPAGRVPDAQPAPGDQKAQAS